MHLITDDLSEAYFAIRSKICDAPRPLTWVDTIRICMPQAKLATPAKKSEITAAEKALGFRFPKAMRELLLETNGVNGLYSNPICSLNSIIEMNRNYRSADCFSDRMPFDHLLFFGETGNGDDFAFPILRNGDVGPAVFMWEHETDCRQEYSSSLIDFLAHYAVQFYALRAK